MSSINSRQNEKLSLDRLAAQNKIYGSAKNKIGFYLFLSIPVIVFLNLMLKPYLLSNEFFGKDRVDISDYIALYALVLSAYEIFYLKNIVSFLRRKAAKVQESFDCYVYSLEWNEVLCGNGSCDIDVKNYSDKYYKSNKRKGDSWLVDWYTSDVDKLGGNRSVLACQAENIGWDVEQRKSFSRMVIVITAFMFIASTIVSLYLDATLKAFVISVIIPCWPLMVFGVNTFFENKEAVQDKENLKASIDSVKSLTNVTTKNVRNIQNIIYLNRRNNPLVFDWFYGFLRDKNQEGVSYATRKLIEGLF